MPTPSNGQKKPVQSLQNKLTFIQTSFCFDDFEQAFTGWKVDKNLFKVNRIIHLRSTVILLTLSRFLCTELVVASKNIR